MKQNTVNILLELGVPAGIKGFTYICDAMELFDTDPYYADGKICALYHEIALQRDTTASRVERAIRHAFETAIKKGKPDVLEQYLDLMNPQNSNLLRTLYLRYRQLTRPDDTSHEKSCCSSDCCEIKQEIYREVMSWMSTELMQLLEHLPETQT